MLQKKKVALKDKQKLINVALDEYNKLVATAEGMLSSEPNSDVSALKEFKILNDKIHRQPKC